MDNTYGKIRIAICDDSKAERDVFFSLISKYSDINGLVSEIDEYICGEDLISAQKSYDLIVLDIIMAELNGIQTAEKIREANSKAQIIFCSTTREYAAESYDVSALYYMIKPVSEEKFFAALDLFFDAYQKCKTVKYKKDRLDEEILVSDILWIETGKNHKTVIHSANGEITTRTTVKDLLSQLDDSNFASPIRYASVNLGAVVTLPTDVFTLQGGETVPIARERRGEMKELFTQYKMKMLLKKGGLK